MMATTATSARPAIELRGTIDASARGSAGVPLRAVRSLRLGTSVIAAHS